MKRIMLIGAVAAIGGVVLAPHIRDTLGIEASNKFTAYGIVAGSGALAAFILAKATKVA